MANATYTRMAATAKAMLAKFGQPITLRRQATSGTAWDPTVTTTDQTIVGVVNQFADITRGASVIDGTLISKDDLEVSIDATVKPLPSDRLIFGGAEYAVKNISEVNPGGVAIMYKLQVRA